MSLNSFAGLPSPYPSAPGLTGDAPPPYTSYPSGPVEPVGSFVWNSSASVTSIPATPPVGYTPVGMKLCYMDFAPRLLRKRIVGKNEYENFSALLQNANTWLQEHSDLQLISVETVSWFGKSHKEIFSDSSVFGKSSLVTYVRGLRVWYMTKIVPSPCRGGRSPVQAILCQTYTARPEETFTHLLSRVNENLTEGSGYILGVETVKMTADESINPETAIWREDASNSKRIVFAFRVYSMHAKLQSRQTIGYQDFVPSRTNRSKDNHGYELYCDVMDRAARWIARQQGVRFTNIQTIRMKIKKSGGSFEERCTFTEHGRGSMNFLAVTRAYFVIEQSAGPGASDPSARLTYRTFSPAAISAAPPNEELPKYEDLRSLLDRINHWLHITGASLFSIETLPVRLAPSSKYTSGPEATYIPGADSVSQNGCFLFYVRVYLNGDYIEPPNAVGLVNPAMRGDQVVYMYN